MYLFGWLLFVLACHLIDHVTRQWIREIEGNCCDRASTATFLLLLLVHINIDWTVCASSLLVLSSKWRLLLLFFLDLLNLPFFPLSLAFSPSNWRQKWWRRHQAFTRSAVYYCAVYLRGSEVGRVLSNDQVLRVTAAAAAAAGPFNCPANWICKVWPSHLLLARSVILSTPKRAVCCVKFFFSSSHFTLLYFSFPGDDITWRLLIWLDSLSFFLNLENCLASSSSTAANPLERIDLRRERRSTI